MLTICSRCRTPYDRRLGGEVVLATGEGLVCGGCRSGSSADTRVPVLLPLRALTAADAMPATVLPVAS